MKKVENLINHIGKKIKYHRNLNKVSLSQLSKDAGISKSTLFGLEEGRSNPTISTLVNIASTLNINLNDLIGSVADESLANSKLSLISKSSCSEYSIYRLILSPYEFFKFNNIVNSVELKVISGELSLVDKDITLHSGDSIITDAKIFKAFHNSTTATIKIYSNTNFLYTKRDILKKSASKELLNSIGRASINSLISRAIFSSITPIEELETLPYVNYIELIEDKESHYYFYKKYFGLIGNLRDLLIKQSANLEDIELIDDYVSSVISNNQIGYNQFKILNKSVYSETVRVASKAIEENNKDIIKIDSIYDLYNSTFLPNSSFYLIGDFIDDSSSELNDTLIVYIYRALEAIEYIKESELNSKELKIQSRLLNYLPKALYYAYCGYSTVSLIYLRELLEFLNGIEQDNSLVVKRALEIIDILKLAISSYENSISLDKISTVKQIAKDLGFKIELKELISPVINKSGLYCYVFSN